MSAPHDLAHAPCFIETQFPVSKLSKESYKERKANYSQTLTGLGKWWGRKPLVLVRATILGLRQRRLCNFIRSKPGICSMPSRADPMKCLDQRDPHGESRGNRSRS
ncbi:MAG: DUF1156 domain-containing protein [Burkholderiales bacterium]